MSNSIPRVVADFETSLDLSVSQGATSATLLSATDTDDVMLASGYYGFTVDNDTDYKEYILCTLTGTALSNIYSVSDQGVATVGFANYHRRGASIEITDHVSLLKLVQTLTGQIGIDSSNPLYYDATPALGSGLQLATVQYVLDHVNGGAVSFNAEIIAGMAGETITIGQWVYFNTADGRWYKTDATNTAKCLGVKIGKALGAGTAGNAITGGVFIHGLETSGTYTAFTTYYLSNTPGAVATSAGTYSVAVGISDANSKLIVSEVAKSHLNALVGNSGTPSSTNTYLTQLSTSAAATDQSQTTQNGTFSAGEANATTRHNKLAQSFIPTKTQLKGVNLYKSANTGTFTGTVSIAIQADSTGAPSGSDLVSKTITNTLYNAYSVGDFLALFANEITVTPGNLYWIVITTSTSDTANCINLGTNTAGGYANGSAKYNNTADGWVAISTIDLYFKTIEGVSGKEVTGNNTGIVSTLVTTGKYKSGTLVVSNASTTIAHGFGKIPLYIKGILTEPINATNTQSIISYGTYDVPNTLSTGLYVVFGNTASNNAGTSTFLSYKLSSNAPSATVTVAAVDENVIIFTATAAPAVTGTSVLYEIIG